MSKIDIDKFVEHLMKWNALDINAVQSALFAQGLTFCGYKIQKIGEIEEKPKWTEEDERHKNTIIRAIHGAGNITPIDGELAEKWLKSLKQRME